MYHLIKFFTFPFTALHDICIKVRNSFDLNIIMEKCAPQNGSSSITLQLLTVFVKVFNFGRVGKEKYTKLSKKYFKLINTQFNHLDILYDMVIFKILV